MILLRPMSKLIAWIEEKTRPAMTLNELAKKLEVSQSLVTLWRQGKRKPGIKQLKKIAKLTGIKVDDLLE
jgi:transcriptional regulator with XRE-family HTH domain